MVERRGLPIPYSTIFICQLTEETQKTIRTDLEEYARGREEELLVDDESGGYMGYPEDFVIFPVLISIRIWCIANLKKNQIIYGKAKKCLTAIKEFVSLMTEIKNQGIHEVFYMDRQDPFCFQKKLSGEM